MAGGRPPKPTQLRVIEGNAGHRPLNRAEPAVQIALPSAPAHLNADAKREWRRVGRSLFDAGILSEVDRAVLAAYCQAYGRWCEAERAIATMAVTGRVMAELTVEDFPELTIQNRGRLRRMLVNRPEVLAGGLLITTSNGNVIQNPLVGIANKAKTDMVRFAAEFGMTPSARSRISADKSPGKGQDVAAKYF